MLLPLAFRNLAFRIKMPSEKAIFQTMILAVRSVKKAKVCQTCQKLPEKLFSKQGYRLLIYDFYNFLIYKLKNKMD